ncbi:uncharacterized protein LKV04_004943 [Tautogolabrus adspersus]
MPPVKVVFVPRFDSQLSESQRDEQETDQDEQQPSQRRRKGRGKKRGKEEKLVLKVKLPKSKKASKEDEAPRRLLLEPTANTTKSTESRGGEKEKQVDEHGAGTQSDSVGGDVFFFSEPPTSKVMNEKEKAKLSVVRTIARMLEENQLIRQRVAALSQIHSLH